MMQPAQSYGLMAEFASVDDIKKAVQRSLEHGLTAIEAYTPFPVDGLAEMIGFRRNYIAPLVLAGGLVGLIGGYFLAWYSSVIDYPYNSGGRPFNSWQAFYPTIFEWVILGAALAAFLGMLFLNGLPRLIHPVFNVPQFGLASRNRFFLCVRADDPEYDPERTLAFLQSLSPLGVYPVPAGTQKEAS